MQSCCKPSGNSRCSKPEASYMTDPATQTWDKPPLRHGIKQPLRRCITAIQQLSVPYQQECEWYFEPEVSVPTWIAALVSSGMWVRTAVPNAMQHNALNVLWQATTLDHVPWYYIILTLRYNIKMLHQPTHSPAGCIIQASAGMSSQTCDILYTNHD